MEIRKQKPKAASPPAESQRPVSRQRVENAWRDAARLNEDIENHAQTGTHDDLTRDRHQQVQRQLAQLRSEAVQARRLAEQILDLSRQTAADKRKAVMNDSFTVDPRQSRDRRASDKPRASGTQARFNPLHPSLELPPEQLIRLLGLEDKQSRKKHKSTPAVVAEPVRADVAPIARPKPAATPGSAATLPPLEVPADHPMREKHRRRRPDAAAFEPRRGSFVARAAVLGVLGGAAISLYLFWWQPTSAPPDDAARSSRPPAPVLRNAPAAQPTPARPSAHAGTVPAVEPTTPDRPTATTHEPTIAPPLPEADPAWRKAVERQEQRLHEAAEKRLQERLHTGLATPAPSGESPTPAQPEHGVGSDLSPTDPQSSAGQPQKPSATEESAISAHEEVGSVPVTPAPPDNADAVFKPTPEVTPAPPEAASDSQGYDQTVLPAADEPLAADAPEPANVESATVPEHPVPPASAGGTDIAAGNPPQSDEALSPQGEEAAP